MTSRVVHVGIVNDHNEILPFFQSLLRAKKISLGGLHMLHFDSHPDLSVPSYTDPDLTMTQHWFNGQTLYYDILDSEGKIAEFLLPMQYTKILRDIVWIKAPWSDQMENGSYRFQLGQIGQWPYVTLDVPYYIDEAVVCHSTESHNEKKEESTVPSLQHAVDLTLHVSKGRECGTVVDCLLKEGEEGKSVPWCLDICLDYFACQNPFWNEIRKALCSHWQTYERSSLVNIMNALDVDIDTEGRAIQDIAPLLADHILQVFATLYSSLRFRHGNVSSECWKCMRSGYAHIYNDQGSDGHPVNSGHKYAKRNRERCFALTVLEEVLLLKGPLEKGEPLWMALQSLYMPADDESNGNNDECNGSHDGKKTKTGLGAVKSFMRHHVSYVTLIPLSIRTTIASTNLMLLLPRSDSPQYDMYGATGDGLLKEMRETLKGLKQQYPHSWPPECITIARSSEGSNGKGDEGKDDGSFTPGAVVDQLEQKVLDMLREVMVPNGNGNGSRKRGRESEDVQLVIHRLHDPINTHPDGREEEEEDAYTRAYRMFLPDRLKAMVSFSERDT